MTRLDVEFLLANFGASYSMLPAGRNADRARVVDVACSALKINRPKPAELAGTVIRMGTFTVLENEVPVEFTGALVKCLRSDIECIERNLIYHDVIITERRNQTPPAIG